VEQEVEQGASKEEERGAADVEPSETTAEVVRGPQDDAVGQQTGRESAAGLQTSLVQQQEQPGDTPQEEKREMEGPAVAVSASEEVRNGEGESSTGPTATSSTEATNQSPEGRTEPAVQEPLRVSPEARAETVVHEPPDRPAPTQTPSTPAGE
jgi:hypothetical protein